MQEDTIPVTKIAQMVHPMFTPLMDALGSFARWATKEDDAEVLAKLDDALEAVAFMTTGIWEVSRQVEPDTAARFQQRQVAVALSIVVRGLADLPRETILADIESFRKWQSERNAAIHNRRAEAEREETRQRELALKEKFERMPIQQVLREIEADGVRLEADSEGRLMVYGQLGYGGRLAIDATRPRLIEHLRARQTPSAVI